jgi:aspartyl-tRNA(Asn)/glutamyl-tRNA(Gln) amidotransferase subunit A
MPEPRDDLAVLYGSPDQTIGAIGRALREGRNTCVDVVEHCLRQVDRCEPRVHAWVALDRRGAVEQARARDTELDFGTDRGPLHGIPVGVKDIIDVAGMPTACGAERWVDRVATADADVVARLRDAGAVILGKTITTPYAWIDPPMTRNPWNLKRTPGGSSSGSAVAVATGMCVAAIGSQTGGSIIRPASFCGVSGMKPSRHGVSTRGVSPFAPSLDHVGPIARTVDDLRAVYQAICALLPAAAAPGAIASRRSGPPRLVRLRGFFDARMDPAIRSLFESAVNSIATRAEVRDVQDPVDFDEVIRDHRVIMAAEAACIHSEWLDTFPDQYPTHIRELILEGRSYSALLYLRARERETTVKSALVASQNGARLDAWITPATIGTAPDAATTGDPAFNSPWSYFGLPTVSFPVGLAADGLPHAIQLIGQYAHDLDLLGVAGWCERVIRDRRQ